MLTHRELLERNASWRTEETALIDLDSDTQYSYGELDQIVNRLANGLRNRGIRKGDRVSIVLYNAAEFELSIYACHKIGAIPVPLNFMLAQDNFEYIFDDIGADGIVYDPGIDEVKGATEAIADSPLLISTGAEPAAGETFEAVLSSETSAPPEIPVKADDISYILYTSGTTGRPKGVTFTIETAFNRASDGATAASLHQGSTALSISPWFHAGGIDITVHPSVYVGCTTIATMDWEPSSVASVIDEYDVTSVVGVPTIIRNIATLDNVDTYDFSSIELLMCMGAPLSEDLANIITENITPELTNVYGTTESLMDCTLRPDSLPQHAGTVGRPGPNKLLRVVEHDPSRTVEPDEEVARAEKGEVIVRGGMILDYYFGNAQATRESMREGWFYTGDMGIIDEEGYLTITGRSDDMILSGGELVSPVEVEETVEKHDDVMDAVVIGTPNDEWGERVTAYVVGDDVTADQLDNFCKQDTGLADYKRPREYRFIEEIERTATGKKQRFKYRS